MQLQEIIEQHSKIYLHLPEPTYRFSFDVEGYEFYRNNGHISPDLHSHWKKWASETTITINKVLDKPEAPYTRFQLKLYEYLETLGITITVISGPIYRKISQDILTYCQIPSGISYIMDEQNVWNEHPSLENHWNKIAPRARSLQIALSCK